MKIVFSKHSLVKIQQRKLDKRKVSDTILHPDLIRTSYGSREERYRHFGKNWMKAVILQQSKTIIVVTAHWVEKPGKK